MSNERKDPAGLIAEPLWPIGPIALGPINAWVLSDGVFRLDGGSMFGVVPKSMWNEWCPADEKNRIDLGLNCLLLKLADGRHVLVDTGMGDKWSAKFVEIYDIRPPRGRLLDQLGAIGLMSGDIDIVIHTHLHLDHTGASTRRDDAGKIVPTFPNAKYYVQQGEWFAATRPDARSKASYNTDHFLPLREAGLLEFTEGDGEVAPGVRVTMTPGHTAYHQSVRVDGGGKTLFYLGDIMPTIHHVSPNYVLGFDLYPLEVMANRARLARQAAEENWLCLWEHDAMSPLGRIKAGEKGRWNVVPESPESKR